MYTSFTNRMNELKKQNLKYYTMEESKFIEHFESHRINLQHIISSEIRQLTRIQEDLITQMYAEDEINTKALSNYIRVSNFKINLALNDK